MADESTEKTIVVRIEADNSAYARNIDAAIAKTKAMKQQAEDLTRKLEANRQQQEKTGKQLEQAAEKFGKSSDEAKKYSKRLEELRTSQKNMESQAKSLNKSIDEQAESMKESANSAGKLQKSASSFMNVIKAAVTGYVGKSFLEATIGGAAQFEQYEASFAVLLGDLQSAKSMLSELQDFAAKTPFKLPDVTEAAQLLMNYGVEADNLIETMTHLGDLSQGQAEKLDRVSLAYGQMLAKGKVTGEELRQMTEAGVPLLQALADELNVSTSALQDMISKGQVGIPQLNAAIESLTTGTGKFAGMMAKQSQTLLGQWSTFKDEIGQTAREIGEGAAGELKTGLSEVRKELDSLRKSGELSSFSKSVGSVMSNTVKVLSFATKAVIEHKEAVKNLITTYATFKIIQQAVLAVQAFQRAMKAATAAQKAMNLVANANPYIALAAALGTVAMVIYSVSTASDTASERLKKLREDADNFETSSLASAAAQFAELDAATTLVPKIEALSNQTQKTAADKKLLADYVGQLNDILGSEIAQIDEVTGSLKNNTEELYNNIEASRAMVKQKTYMNDIVALQDEINEAEKENEELIRDNSQRMIEVRKQIKDIEGYRGPYVEGTNEAYAVLIKELEDYESKIKKNLASIDLSNAQIAKLYEKIEGVRKEAPEAQKAMAGFWSDIAAGASSSVAAIAEVRTLTDGLATLKNAELEYSKAGAVSAATLENLVKAYPALSEKVEEYALGLIEMPELLQELSAAYENDRATYFRNSQSKLQTSQRFYQQSILSQNNLINEYKDDYGIDLSNFTSLAQAKEYVEKTLIRVLSESWQEYYQSVGGNASTTVSAIEAQISTLEKQRVSEPNKAAIDNQIQKLKGMILALKPLRDLENIEMQVDWKTASDNFDAMTKDIGNSASATAKKVNDVLKETYNEQLKIAKEYYSEQKKQIEAHYKSQAEAIKNAAKAETDALNARYEREKSNIQSAIDEIDRLIAAKQRAREEEKLDDELAFTKKRVETLETQITYARTPEEAEELKKELARQQEALKDLNVQIEVNALEQQKQAHQDKLSQIEEEHKAQLEYIEERRDAELEALEAAQEKTLNDLEVTFNQFSDNLAATYGYVNNETLAIGQRFANATTGALESGFTVVARKAQEQINSMVAQVEDAIYRLDEAYANIMWARERGREQERGYSYNYSDGRSMQVTNHITRGLTESQVARMLDRQAERFLYGRR